jgi:NADH dehydrogenase (ubiquinone) Fe-S protein 2
MHANFIRPGGVAQDMPIGLAADIYNFVQAYRSRIEEVIVLLNANRV